MNIKNWLTLTVRTLDFNLVAKQPELLAKLRKLTLSPSSGLNYELNHMEANAKKRKVEAKIILARRFNNLIGWGLLSKEDSNFNFPSTHDYFRSINGHLFQVFVNPEYRRQGIASEIFKKAKDLAGNEMLHICPWDNGGHHFYSKFPDVNKKVI
jgi:GNAT superfamily N-acetyltransferase